MKARHDRRTWWIVGALVVVCGVGVAFTSASLSAAAPPGWEAVAIEKPKGGVLRRPTVPFAAHLAVLRFEGRTFRVVEDAGVVARVPAEHELAFRRVSGTSSIQPRAQPVDIVAAPRLAVEAPESRLELTLRTSESPLGGERMRVHAHASFRAERRGESRGDWRDVGVGEVFGPIPGARAPKASLPFRNEIVLARIIEAATITPAWTGDDWRAAVARDAATCASELTDEPSRERGALLAEREHSVSRLALLAVRLHVTDALPALRSIEPKEADEPARFDLWDLRIAVRTARRALGDPDLGPPSEYPPPPAAFALRAALSPTDWSLIARATDDPAIAAWAVSHMDAEPPAAAVDDLLAAHAAGDLELTRPDLARLDRLQRGRSSEVAADTAVEAVVSVCVLAALVAIVFYAFRRLRRSYVTAPGTPLAAACAVVLASLDVPVVFSVVAPAPLALLAAAWGVRRLGRDLPGRGTSSAAAALVAAAALWVVAALTTSAWLEALGQASEFLALLLVLRAAASGEPVLLALQEPPRAPPRWTVPVRYVALAALTFLVVMHSIDTQDPRLILDRMRDPQRVALPLSAGVAAAVGVWIGTGGRARRESPPVVRTALAAWLGMLHVAAILTALLAVNVLSRQAGIVGHVGGGAAVLFVILVFLRLDAVLTDLALSRARSKMIRAVREAEPDA